MKKDEIARIWPWASLLIGSAMLIHIIIQLLNILVSAEFILGAVLFLLGGYFVMKQYMKKAETHNP